MENKEEIRLKYKQKRIRLTSKKEELDLAILEQIKIFAKKRMQTVLNYYPSIKFKEPNMLLFIEEIKKQNATVKIAYPVMDVKTRKMQIYAVNDNTSFKENNAGILEPVGGLFLHPTDLDLVFVPLLAFDKRGYRVGYGRGFYDRFLKLCAQKTLFVGISYFPPIEKIENVDNFDVPLHYCITPEKIYEF